MLPLNCYVIKPERISLWSFRRRRRHRATTCNRYLHFRLLTATNLLSFRKLNEWNDLISGSQCTNATWRRQWNHEKQILKWRFATGCVLRCGGEWCISHATHERSLNFDYSRKQNRFAPKWQQKCFEERERRRKWLILSFCFFWPLLDLIFFFFCKLRFHVYNLISERMNRIFLLLPELFGCSSSCSPLMSVVYIVSYSIPAQVKVLLRADVIRESWMPHDFGH